MLDAVQEKPPAEEMPILCPKQTQPPGSPQLQLLPFAAGGEGEAGP